MRIDQFRPLSLSLNILVLHITLFPLLVLTDGLISSEMITRRGLRRVSACLEIVELIASYRLASGKLGELNKQFFIS